MPRMADLPLSRPRLFKPPFFSTGMDCIGPFRVKTGRRHEKRWGLLFKYQTTRCVHIETLDHLDTDSFLQAFRRFVSRRGCPFELISDQGANLQETFTQLSPSLQEQLAKNPKYTLFKTPLMHRTLEEPGKERCGQSRQHCMLLLEVRQSQKRY